MSLDDELRALAHELGRGTAGSHAEYLKVRALVYGGWAERALDLPLVAAPPVRLWWSVRALCLAHLGRHDEARAIREQFAGLDSDEDPTAAHILARLLEDAILGGDSDTAATLSRRLAGMAAYSCDAWEPVCWARLLGGAAALLDEREQARAYHEQALEVAAKIRFRPEIALTHLQIAELMLDWDARDGAAAREGPHPRPLLQGEGVRRSPAVRAEALAHLDFAIGELREMKMQPSLERALRHKQVLKA